MSEPATEVGKTLAEKSPEEDMDIEFNAVEDPGTESGGAKQLKEGGERVNGENGDASKKAKIDKSVEEQRMESLEGSEIGEEEKNEDKSGPVSLGPKSFGSSIEMFDYFYKLLHYWTPNINLNKYEHMVLLELIKKGHAEPEKKMGKGVKAFQVRNHPVYKSRCFFILRVDGSDDDFSFRKCVDRILPLPENMQVKHNANKALAGRKGGRGGGKGGRGGGGGRGRGRGK